jgi:predicted PurR-regulated permease PerM
METFLGLLIFMSVIALIAICIATLVVSVKIYKMHDVRNEDGEYAWMVPSSFISLQERLNESQERIVENIGESSRNQKEVGRLLESLVSVTLSLSQNLNGIQRDVEKK